MKRLAIIPARSGSKGLPDKNIRPLCGKPLLAYTVEAALESGLFDLVLVSTDSPRYAAIADEYGAQVCMRRPELADDRATTYQLLKDLFTNQGIRASTFALLQPTSPLRRGEHIRQAVTLFEAAREHFDFLVSVKPAKLPPHLVRPVDTDNSLKYFDADYTDYRRQEAAYYSPNGAIYLADTAAYLEQKHFFGPRAMAYYMALETSVDIDTLLDFELATLLMKTGQ